METKMIYYAKDGMRFDDPIKCAEYERNLGTLPGTVGELKKTLEPYKDYYVLGVLVIWHKGKSYTSSFITAPIGYILERYTDVDELPEEERFIKYKMSNVINLIEEKYDDDDLCEYSFLYSKTLDYAITGYMKSNNQTLWDKMNYQKSEQSV